MRTGRFLLIALMLFPRLNNAQPYIPFPTDSAYWSVDYTMPGPFGQIFHMARLYFLRGDTLINGITYHKMFQNDTTTGSAPVPPIVLIREQNKKIYCWHYLTNPVNDEYVLYDFNLNVGDTFAFPEIVDSVKMVVTAINTEMTSTGLRKAYDFIITVNPINVFFKPPRWVEGIGDINNGVLPKETPPFDWSPQALCFSNATGLIWTWSGNTCWPLGLNEPTYETSLILRPNPCNEKVTIAFQAQPAEEVKFEILSGDGRRMMTFKTAEKETEVEVKNLPAGIYLLKESSKNSLSFRRIVKL